MHREDDRVWIFDTTLRDGEQSPGASMTLSEKITMAAALADLGVDVIEAGFPAASTGDFEAVRAVAREVEGPAIAGLARCHQKDIDRTWEALREAGKARIHVFLATSPIHREYKLKMTRSQILERVASGIAYARTHCLDVEFSAEDAARTEVDFLAEVLEVAIASGASVVNIPDTVGYAVPGQFAGLIRSLMETVPNMDQATLSVHCHNDLGLAVANSLAAIQAGARQVECTINGIGERAGNCALEELVMALRTRHDVYRKTTGVRTPKINATSRTLVEITGMEVQRNKAIVGANAFAHEAGIHQHGMLMNRESYEIMRPEDVGVQRNTLVLGKHSGRHAFAKWLEENRYELDEKAFQAAFASFKALADSKKDIDDGDLQALVEGRLVDEIGPWQLVGFQTSTGTDTTSTAAVSLRHVEDRRVVEDAACGKGPLEALFRAIERIAEVHAPLKSFQLSSKSRGKDAVGQVSLSVMLDGRENHGKAASTDVLEASARAFLGVVNRHLSGLTKDRTKLASVSTTL